METHTKSAVSKFEVAISLINADRNNLLRNAEILKGQNEEMSRQIDELKQNKSDMTSEIEQLKGIISTLKDNSQSAQFLEVCFLVCNELNPKSLNY